MTLNTFYLWAISLISLSSVLSKTSHRLLPTAKVTSVSLMATDYGPLVQLLFPAISAELHPICVMAGESWRADWLAFAHVTCRQFGETTFTQMSTIQIPEYGINSSYYVDGYCFGNEQLLEQCEWKSVKLGTECFRHLSVSCGECVHTMDLALGQTISLASPGHPDKYLYLMSCRWTIQSAKDTVISIDILVWELPGKSDTCNHYLDFGGVDSKDGSFRLCPSGNQSHQRSFRSRGNSLTISYRSGHLVPDVHYKKLGFSLQLKAISANTVKDVWFMFKSLVLLFIFIGIVVVIIVCYCCMKNYRKRYNNNTDTVCCPCLFNKCGSGYTGQDAYPSESDFGIYTSIVFNANNNCEQDSDNSYLSPLSSGTIRSANMLKVQSVPQNLAATSALYPPTIHVEGIPNSKIPQIDENEYDIIYTPMNKMSSSQPNRIGQNLTEPSDDKPFHSMLNLKLAARQRPLPTVPTTPALPTRRLQKPLDDTGARSMPQLQHAGKLILPHNLAASALVLPVSHPHAVKTRVDLKTESPDEISLEGATRKPQPFPWMAKIGLRPQRKSRSSVLPLMDL